MSKGIGFYDNNGPVTILNQSKTSRPSILGKLVEIIAEGASEKKDLTRDPIETITKINHNNLDEQKWIAMYYYEKSLLVDESIRQLNQNIINGSTKLKQQMNLFYKKALAKYSISIDPVDIEKLKQYSDDVLKEVVSLVENFLECSADLKEGYFQEDLVDGAYLITSYSIIECVVLESGF